RWVFFINLPVSIAGLFLVHLYVFDPPYLRRTKKGIDYWGLGMLVTGIAALQIVLDKGQESDWFSSRFILALAIIAVLGLAAFVIWELVARDPMVHLHLLKYRTFSTAVVLSIVLFFVLYGSILLLPLFMQEVLNFPAITAGVWNCPRGIATMILMPVAGYLIGRRWDMRALLFGGIVVSAVGVLWFSYLDLNTGPWNFLWPQIVMGAGLGFVFVPFATITVDPIPNEEMGFATSITGLTRNLGAGFGISIAATLLERRDQVHQVRLVAHLNPSNPKYTGLLSALQNHFHQEGASPATASHQALGTLYFMVQHQASVLSYLDSFRILAVMFVAVAPLVWIMRKPRFKGPGGGAH
ncbi:MAG: DHA2 family efflux MFS transporter permease subunit, partial [Terriglobia bacterium]